MTAIGMFAVVIGVLGLEMAEEPPWDALWEYVITIGALLILVGSFLFVWDTMP